MNLYITALHSYLNAHSVEYGDADIHSLLEFLWRSYTQLNPINNESIRNRFLELDPIFDSLDHDYADILFHIVCTLCEEHERLAFLEGIHVGVRLIDELNRHQPKWVSGKSSKTSPPVRAKA